MRTLKIRSAKALAVVFPAIAILVLISMIVPNYRHQTQVTGPSPLRSSAAGSSLSPRPFWLGIRERGIPGPWTPVNTFTASVGISPQLVLYYSGWLEPFQWSFAQEAHVHHATVIIQIQPWEDLAAISAGHYDGYLRSFATAVRRFGHPVIIGFGHEMNGRWYPWGYGHQSPTAFVKAWRHVVQLFYRCGARNDTWLWTVSSSGGKHAGPLKPYWPGTKYVTWVGIDGYYYTRHQDFAHVYGSTISQIRKFTNLPILLAETGIGQIAGQARELPTLFAGIRREHLLGLVWFDVAQHKGLYHQDWRLEGHPAAIAAFRKGVRSVLAGH